MAATTGRDAHDRRKSNVTALRKMCISPGQAREIVSVSTVPVSNWAYASPPSRHHRQQASPGNAWPIVIRAPVRPLRRARGM